MQPKISVKNGKVSEKTKEYVEKACAKLDRFFDKIIDCEVVLEKQKQNKQVEFILKVPHQTLAASCTDENLYKAVDEAQNRVEAQLKKYHDRLVAHR